MNTPKRREIALGLMEGLQENLNWFPRTRSFMALSRGFLGQVFGVNSRAASQ
jgi:hypothetical protein